MFEKTDTLQLFPTFVWRHQLAPEHVERINRSTLRALDAVRAGMASPARGELAQTEPNLHARPEFSDLLDVVDVAVRGVLDFVAVSYESFAITGCWANIAAPGARHKIHTHPNNYLSGVYYLKVPDGAESITFLDPRPQTMVISPRVERDNPANAGKMTITVNEGLLLIFPAWLAHSVDPNDGDDLRISISFNAMFTSFAESMSEPRWSGRSGAEPAADRG